MDGTPWSARHQSRAARPVMVYRKLQLYRGQPCHGSATDGSGTGAVAMMTGIDNSFDRIDLARAIDALYEAFDAYPLKERVDSCPHCELDAAERRLHVRPLREMTWADLGTYSFKAMTAFGDEDDFKHFLPRVLELYVLDHVGAPYSLFVFLGKLDSTAWMTWPAEEIAVVRRFIDAWERVLIARARESEEGAWALEELRAGISAL